MRAERGEGGRWRKKKDLAILQYAMDHINMAYTCNEIVCLVEIINIYICPHIKMSKT